MRRAVSPSVVLSSENHTSSPAARYRIRILCCTSACSQDAGHRLETTSLYTGSFPFGGTAAVRRLSLPRRRSPYLFHSRWLERNNHGSSLLAAAVISRDQIPGRPLRPIR